MGSIGVKQGIYKIGIIGLLVITMVLFIQTEKIRGETVEREYNYRKIPIAINGQDIPVESGGINLNGVNMVPLKLLEQICGYELYWEESTRTAVVIKGEEDVRVKVGSEVGYINGESKFMNRPPVIIDGRIFVSMDFLKNNTELEVYWSPINEKVNVYDPNLKSPIKNEMQEKFKTRIENSLDKTNQQLNNLERNSYVELVIFDNINSIVLNENYLQESLAYTSIVDVNDKIEGRELILEEKPKGGSIYNNLETRYYLNRNKVDGYKIIINDNVEKKIYEDIYEYANEDIKEHEHLELNSKDKEITEIRLDAVTNLIKNEGTQIIGAERIYSSNINNHQAVFEHYINPREIDVKTIPKVYPMSKITKVHNNLNNYVELQVKINEGTEQLGELNYSALLNVDLQKEFSNEIGLNNNKGLWVYMKLSHTL